uniref:Uncharacterized protein n=1 Tax=Setaria italica TaxID=4555 RepID=K3Y072_SETIT
MLRRRLCCKYARMQTLGKGYVGNVGPRSIIVVEEEEGLAQSKALSAMLSGPPYVDTWAEPSEGPSSSSSPRSKKRQRTATSTFSHSRIHLLLNFRETRYVPVATGIKN